MDVIDIAGRTRVALKRIRMLEKYRHVANETRFDELLFREG